MHSNPKGAPGVVERLLGVVALCSNPIRGARSGGKIANLAKSLSEKECNQFAKDKVHFPPLSLG